jgi:DNA-directed RNA polymerase beta' subunit
MGTSEVDMKCGTCGLGINECPGHPGHFYLAEYIVLPGAEKIITEILSCICITCGNLLLPKYKRDKLLTLPRKVRLREASKAMLGINKRLDDKRICPFCGSSNINRFIFDKTNYVIGKDDTMLPNKYIKTILLSLKPDTLEYLGFSMSTHPHKYIINFLIIAPPGIRPQTSSGEGKKEEDRMTTILIEIINANKSLAEIKLKKDESKIKDYKNEMQKLVTNISIFFFNGNNEKGIQSMGKAVHQLKSIKELLKGKDGHIRGRMEGRIVCYAGRSVITPDGNLLPGVIAIPKYLCMTITKSEVITKYNLELMRQRVKNGDNAYPGASMIIKKDRTKLRLKGLEPAIKKEIIANLTYGDVVFRHLVDGDVVLFNRQPSIHRYSILAFNVNVKHDNSFSISFNPVCVEPFNADFDGDEMNIFVPQSYEAIAEAQELMSIENNIISNSTKTPHITLIQDSILGLFLMTRDKHKEISKEFYLDIMGNSIFYDRIIKKKTYKVGDIFNSIIPNDFNYNTFTVEKVRDIYKSVGKEFDTSSYVNPYTSGYDKIFDNGYDILIQNGTIIYGNLNKSGIKNLIKYINLNYGGEYTIKFISALQKCADRYLCRVGFTVSLYDCYYGKEFKKKSRDILAKAIDIGNEAVNKPLPSLVTVDKYSAFTEIIRTAMNPVLREISDDIKTYLKKNPNNLNTILQAGSKGDISNLDQIGGYIGHQSVQDNIIMPTNEITQRVHIYDTKYLKNVISYGFIPDSFSDSMKTIKEIYSHNSAARIGTIDTAINVTKNGDNSRKLNKMFEDIIINYDLHVVDNKGRILSTMFGYNGFYGKNVYNVSLRSVNMSTKEIESVYF